jgi:hypothetical protein
VSEHFSNRASTPTKTVNLDFNGMPQISPIKNPLDRSEISHIEYREDPSLSMVTSGYPQTDREFMKGASGLEEVNEQYNNYYNQYKK